MQTHDSDTRTDIDCGHCERPEDRCSDESDRNCYRPTVCTPVEAAPHTCVLTEDDDPDCLGCAGEGL